MPNKSDTALARIAASQHGVITAKQLAAVGLGRSAISERTRKGRLHRVHQGVYAVGHTAPNLHGRWMAAVLACGEGAVLSHGSAAVLWKLLKPLDGPVHVSVPTTSGRKIRRGIHLHRTPALRLTTYRDGIPVTTVARTIEDLHYISFPPRLLRRAIRQAEFMGLRLNGIETDRSRSDLEVLFLQLCRRHRLPPPEVNVKLGRWEVDFLWRSQGVVVETDSWTYHRGSVAFEDDHARDLDLRAAGYTVLRFTHRQLEGEPERVAAVVCAALVSEEV
jgi:very-short-patch-repair endonuclease